MRIFAVWQLVLALALLGPSAAWADACTLDKSTGTTIEAAPMPKGAYNARWNAATNRIAMMAPDAATGYYRIFTIAPDGTGRRAMPAVSSGHQGSVFWHPSGKYLLFTAQKEGWHGRKLFGLPDYEAIPGYGLHNEIWLATADGKQSWQLTHTPDSENHKKPDGNLLPVFSPDGKHIAWSARQAGGTYKITLADFVETPQPHLENLKTYAPGGDVYYEPGSFTSDSKSLIYTSSQDTHSFWMSQIYRLDLASGKSTRLTVGNYYNEHPVVVPTPSGDRIVYMSTKGVKRRGISLFLGTDWYAVDVNGAGEKRLTAMNVPGKDNPEDAKALAVACTIAMSPAGDYFLGDVQDDLVHQTGSVKVVRLTCDK
ncbi:MAG: hypothetical protein PW788_00890 [Micavibrio sp.]|nr:hypothetical protein [Micavibrio sp.]